MKYSRQQLTLRILLIAGIVIFNIVLRVTYSYLIVPLFSYDGFSYNYRIPEIFHFWSWAIALLPGLWLPVSYRRPSQVIIWILYVLVYAPFTFIPLHVNTVLPDDEVILAQGIIFLCFSFLCLTYFLPRLKIKILPIPAPVAWSLVAAFCIVFYLFAIPNLGINPGQVIDVDLDQTYVIRDSYKESLTSIPSIFNYLLEWQGNVINPLMIAQGMLTGNVFLAGFGLFGELYIFSVAGFKSMLFSGIIILALLLGVSFKGKYFGILTVFGMSLITGVSAAIYFLTDEIAVLSIVRRLAYVPARITTHYLEFFTVNPKTLLSYGVLRWLFTNPYSHEPSALICDYEFASFQCSANANFWGDAFANFGYAGIIVFTVLVLVTLWVFDSLAVHHDYRFSAVMAGIPSITLANTAFLTGFLTHGIGLTLLFMYILAYSNRKYAYPRLKNTPRAHWAHIQTLFRL